MPTESAIDDPCSNKLSTSDNAGVSSLIWSTNHSQGDLVRASERQEAMAQEMRTVIRRYTLSLSLHSNMTHAYHDIHHVHSVRPRALLLSAFFLEANGIGLC